MARKGKYADVIPHLPKYKPEFEDPNYQAKVDAVKTHLRGKYDLTGVNLAALYAEQRTVKDKLDEQVYNNNLMIEALCQLLYDRYEIEGVTSVALFEGPTIRIQMEPYGKIEDPEAFRKWCIETGLEKKLTLPWNSMNSIVKERLLNGEPEPPGVKAYQKPKFVRDTR
jgi:hypothetical protein